MSQQQSLFDHMIVPPYHRGGTATERHAAISMINSSASLRARIYAFIRLQGGHGVTRDELDQAFGKTPNVTQPRLVELEGCSPYCIKVHRHLPGLIEKTDRTRITRSGRPATVYVAIRRDDGRMSK